MQEDLTACMLLLKKRQLVESNRLPMMRTLSIVMIMMWEQLLLTEVRSPQKSHWGHDGADGSDAPPDGPLPGPIKICRINTHYSLIKRSCRSQCSTTRDRIPRWCPGRLYVVYVD